MIVCSCDNRTHQFLRCVAGTTQATHDERSRSIRQISSLGHARTGGQRQRKGCCNGITGTIGINDLAGVVKAMKRQV